MKRLKIRIKLLMGTTALLFSTYSTAQLPPTSLDVSIIPGSPQHVGNSAVGNYLSVSCWDGTTPEIYWETPMLSGTIPISETLDISIQDPDIVAFPGSEKFCVVYQKGGHIYAELWAPVGLTYSIIEGPIMISNGKPYNLYPNVDQLENGAAFVWQQNGEIKGRYWDLTVGGLTTPLALGGEVLISRCFPKVFSTEYTNREPDVSVYRSGGQDVANVVFISYDYDANTENLIIQRLDLDDFYVGLPVNCSEWSELMPSVADPYRYNNPRVASPKIGSAVDFTDCETVVSLTTAGFCGTQQIIGINGAGATPVYNPILLNNTSDVQYHMNAFPVVSYNECGIIVEWEYSATSCIIPSFSGNIVLARHLNYSGIPAPPYSAVNSNMFSTMARPAVASRYRTTDDNIYSTYTDGFFMYQRYSLCTSLFMRKKSISNQEIEKKSEFSFYPNPANDNLDIKMIL
ncbi:MAG: hypothetical protein JKY48_05575, partial [Flavobacteriales bacterium]|nr:hypothetical protein [Flavobacteriales bacterium]